VPVFQHCNTDVFFANKPVRIKVSRQKYAFVISLLLSALTLGACADTEKKYRDTSELEQPPQLPVVAAASEKTDDGDAKPSHAKALADAVSLTDDSHLVINLPFDVSWQLIEKAAEISGMEVADKNREKGQVYLLFDPDSADQKSAKDANLFTDFFTANDYPKGRYLLTFYENAKSVKIEAKFLEYTESHDSAQDGYAERVPADDGVAKLLKKLYSTLHDDLPTN
jgi:hypothetical protein